MPRIAILADTHVPSRRAAMPGFVREEVEAADHVIHAGDLDSRQALEVLREASNRLTVVQGNMDPPIDLPRVETVELGGVTFVVTHGHLRSGTFVEGVADTVESELESQGREPAGDVVGVAGHSHEIVDEERDGIRILNPGTATGAPPGSEATMYRATASDGELEVELLRQ